MEKLRNAFPDAPASHYSNLGMPLLATPKHYKSKKIVTATECTSDEWRKIRSSFRNYSDASVPGGMDGYRVTYDEGTSKEYHSWSPKEVFERGYDAI